MKKEIKYIIPGFLNLYINEIMIDIYKRHQEVTREDTSLYSFYGTFPKAIWNGGRTDIDAPASSVSFMKRVRDFYNKRGYAVTFTFTNPHIDETHLNDPYCNEIMEVFHNGMNEVLVVSKVLESYIRKTYPNYKVNRSITFADSENPYDTSNYFLSVIDKHFNHDIEKLKEIKEKDKIEILCDETCVNNCPYTKQHYSEIGILQLGEIPPNPAYGRCRFLGTNDPNKMMYIRNKTSIYYISPEDVSNIYAPMGFKYFKLSGREPYNFIGFESVINYCIKPEYQNDVRSYIMERVILHKQEEIKSKLKYDKNFTKGIDMIGWKYV